MEDNILVLVETYRGYDIYFNRETSEFTADIADSFKGRHAFTSVKKDIDQYISGNSEFKPFAVVKVDWNGNKRIPEESGEIVGIRKDEKPIILRNGVKGVLSDYAEKDWALDITDESLKSELESKINDLTNKIDSMRAEASKLKSMFKLKPLSEYLKDNFLG